MNKATVSTIEREQQYVWVSSCEDLWNMDWTNATIFNSSLGTFNLSCVVPGCANMRCTKTGVAGVVTHRQSHMRTSWRRYRYGHFSMHLVTGNISTNPVKLVWKCLLYSHKLCIECFVDLFKNCEPCSHCRFSYLYEAQSEFYAVFSPRYIDCGVTAGGLGHEVGDREI